MKLVLLVTEHSSDRSVAPRTVRASGGQIFLGREGTPVLLADPQCSRQHLILFEDAGGALWMKDLNSTNGTYVNERRVDSYRLREGVEFRIGSTLIEVLSFKSSQRTPVAQIPRRTDTEFIEVERERTNVTPKDGKVVVSWPEAITCLPPDKQAEFKNFLPAGGRKGKNR